MPYAHGNNDARKSMGIITLALVNAGLLDKNAGIPLWVKVLCAIAMALGTYAGRAAEGDLPENRRPAEITLQMSERGTTAFNSRLFLV